jgi:thiol-disulfide isomerase/thioredoxin
MTRVVSLVGVLAAALALSVGNATADEAGVSEGKPAVNLTVSNWKNTKALNIADLKGKVVVLKFWATWCAPCKSTLPKFEKLSKSYKDKVVFIGVHDKKESGTMAAFVERNKFTFFCCEDDTGATTKAYGVKALPFNVLIDKKGNVKKLDAEIDEKTIDALLAE